MTGVVLGCVNAHGMGYLQNCDSNTNAERYIQVLEQYTLQSSRHPCLFQQDSDKSPCAPSQSVASQ